jgi:drug/metabolite transporter, DME family
VTSDALSSGSTAGGRMLLVAAATLWSTSGLFVKSPPLAELPTLEAGPALACYRALFAAAFLLPFVRPRAVRWRPMLVPMVLAFTGMNALFVTALTWTTAAAAIFLQYTSTVWAFVFGVVLLRERVDRGNLIALAAALCGIGWIVAADWHGEHFVGNLVALASGFCYAGVIFCLRWLRDEDSAWLVWLNHAVAGVALLPWVLTLGLSLGAVQWTLVGLLGVSQMALPYVLFARGVRTVKTQEAALIILIEPVLNPLWVRLLWGEAVATATWIGGGFILGGLAARYLLFPPRAGGHPEEPHQPEAQAREEG